MVLMVLIPRAASLRRPAVVGPKQKKTFLLADKSKENGSGGFGVTFPETVVVI